MCTRLLWAKWPTRRNVIASSHIKNNTWITALGSLNKVSFDVVYAHSIRGFVHLPINGPLSFEASTTGPSDGADNARSTLASFQHKPLIDGENRRTVETKRGGGVEVVFDRRLRGGKCKASPAPCRPTSASSSNDGWIEAHPNNRNGLDTEQDC